ncbi:HNH endonuclease [Flagellimonas myxillae]|uniref:HNH endonuclease n=1 Tax=Flagellimonas myxillae TaxID=2942214 RepID=UPI00201F1416|nr:HNH endonuclease [Muricauda myxillae]MCL6264935.1 HNH endonuclease [Muricauda myxillae]
MSKKDSGWTHEELRASVESYLDIQRRIREGEKPIKKRYYERLSEQYGRSIKAFEYRMQNISYVLSLQGREWLSGLTPRSNVGTNIAVQIEDMISRIESREPNPVVAFETKVKSALTNKNLEKPIGNEAPKRNVSSISDFERDFKVKAWVLKNANGKCEFCSNPAPFETNSGIPYLEVHHVRRLADGGSDKIENTVALCPNCHKEFHYGINRKEIVVELYRKVPRLIFE